MPVLSSARFHNASKDLKKQKKKKNTEGLPVCQLNFHWSTSFFCIVEYTVLIFYMATVHDVW